MTVLACPTIACPTHIRLKDNLPSGFYECPCRLVLLRHEVVTLRGGTLAPTLRVATMTEEAELDWERLTLIGGAVEP